MIRYWCMFCGLYLTFVSGDATAGAVYIAAFFVITALRKPS